MKLVEEGVYCRTFMGLVNVYVLKTPEGVIIVDAALNARQMHKLISELPSIGASVKDVTGVFITHAHPDHVGGLPSLLELLPDSVKVITHAVEAPITRGDVPMSDKTPEHLNFIARKISDAMPSENPYPARVDVEVREGDCVGEYFEVIELHGHSLGQSGLWWPEKRLLIGGDVMMDLPIFGLIKPLALVTLDMPLAIQSIHKVAAMPVEILALGHGAPTKGAHQRIQRLVEKLR